MVLSAYVTCVMGDGVFYDVKQDFVEDYISTA